MKLFQIAVCICTIFLSNLVYAGADFAAPEPEDLVLYQVFIDRFNNGSTANDGANPRAPNQPTNPTGFHGGDLEGIRQKLPYIKGLGANGIWITPFVENVTEYHGYAAYNWYNVEPNFGTLNDLKSFVNDAHELGIAVYFDMVAGHCGNLIDSTNGGYPAYLAPPSQYTLRWRSARQYPAPFNSLSYFHAHGHIGNFSSPEQELGELFGLDDLKTDTQFVRDEMLAIWKYWVQQTKVDGFRVDTVKHVDLGFWQFFWPELRAEASSLGIENFYTFGEIYGADDSYMRTYIGTLNNSPYKFDAALDFQFYYACEGVFARADAAPSNIVNRLVSRASNLPGHHLKMPNFFDNHDVRRFMAVTNDRPGSGLAERRKRLEQALVFLFTAPGPPVVYYGTEQAFDGGNDPYNREDMFDGSFEFGPSLGDNFDTASPYYELIALLSEIRKQNAPLRRGNIISRHAETNGAGALAMTRGFAGEMAVVLMNTATASRTVPSFTDAALAGWTLTNGLNPEETLTIPQSGVFPERTLAGQSSEIWIMNFDVTIPPGVVAFSPAEGAVNVPIDLNQIVIEFRTEMDRDLAQAAISIDPPVAWSGSWSSDSRTMNLEILEMLQARTAYTVIVASTAVDTSGATIAPASAEWVTQRSEMPLPPLPAAMGPLRQTTITVNVDGNASEWPSTAGMAENTGTINAENTFAWKDAVNDDDGPGAYTYPTNAVFSTGDADIDYVQFAYDENNFYFLLKSTSINPTGFFFTPYYGIAIDCESGGSAQALGHDQETGAMGVSELELRNDAAADFELVFTGPRGATLANANGVLIANPPSQHSQANGVIEIAVARADLGLAGPMNSKRINLCVFSGLETFGSMREVAVSSGEWNPGGGIVEATDPDVFDLVGATHEQQKMDLANYDELFQSVAGYSMISLDLSESEISPVHGWMILE